MRIDGVNNVNNVYKTKKAKNVYGTANVSSSKDTLAISDFAKTLQSTQQAVSDAPDVRQEKVDDIKQRMEAGNYNVTASQLADKLLKKYFE